MNIIKKSVATLACASALLLSVTSVSMAAERDFSKIKLLFLVWSEESNSFFEPVVNGARDAAKQQGITIDVQYGNTNAAAQNTITETAIGNKISGIATTIWDDEAFNEVLCKAQKQGIPVIAYNIDNSKGAAGGSCRLAFVGQNFVDSGYTLGKRMIAQHHLKKGDLVFTPVETPEAVYAVLRHAGVAKAMDEIGATTELLGTGNDHGDALTKMTQYLLGHPKTAAVIGLGQNPTSQAIQAIKDAGLTIPAGGYDVSSSIIADIEAGKLTATVDQQPYSQGYFAVTQLALNLKYGLYPSDMATGGTGLIDKTNTASAKEWAGKTR